MTHPVTVGDLEPDFRALRERIVGEVATRDDERWDAARQVWGLAPDQQPALAVLVETAADIVTTAQWAEARALRVVVQGNALGCLDDAVLIVTPTID